MEWYAKRSSSEQKAKQAKLVERPQPTFVMDKTVNLLKQSAKVPWHMQIEFRDDKGNPWYMDSHGEISFNFNNFNGWECSAVIGVLLFVSLMVVLNDPKKAS